MSIQCARCGRFDSIGKASVIADEQTTRSSVMRYGMTSSGQPATYYQNVVSQSDLARNLTADEPREGSGCVRYGLVCFLLLYPITGMAISVLALMLGGLSNGGIGLLILFLASLIVAITIIIISAIVGRKNTNSFNRRHAQWYAIFDRRYHCSSCGNIFQI